MPAVARALVAATVMAACLAVGARRLTGSAQAATGPAVTLRMIVVSSAEAADRILARLTSGESFAVVATAESLGPNAASGGWLGRIPLAQLRPDVRRALEGVTPGHLTPVVRLPTGFAIFKVEEDEPAARAAPGVDAALASSGVVKYVYDVSGFSEARIALDAFPKAAGWDRDARSMCAARTQALAATQASVEAYLARDDAEGMAARTPVDVMQLHAGLAQIAAYQGRMDAAVAEFEQASHVAAADMPTAALPFEEALGVALLHKAAIDNDIPGSPGDYCLLGPTAGPAYPRATDVRRAIDHFQRYLAQKPGDLEVRWLLNLAYRALGGYPGDVPAAALIPPAAFRSAEDVGRFRDVAPQAGLAGTASAGGLVVEDLDGSGRFDIVSSTMDTCQPMKLMRNNGDGTFTNRTAGSGLDDQFGGLNLVPGDYDNDGCQDLLVLRGGWEYLPQRMSLLRNDCHGTFTDVTAASGLATPIASQTAVWTDIDNDGFLDLFVGSETAPARLYRNTGRGTFEDISRAAGVDRAAFTKGVAAADYDNDRYPDLYVSNYGETNFLYHNNRNGTFTEFSAAARVPGTPTGFATWFFDYDNDGLSDLFVTSYVSSIDEMVRDRLGLPHNATTMKLYRNAGDGTFRDVAAQAGLDRVLMPMGANFGDLDNDGFLDVFLGTGQPSYAALAGSVLLRNRGGRDFVDVTASSGTGELHRGHGVAFADLDNDGDEDLVFEVGGVTPGDTHAMRLFENPGHGHDWIAVKLVGVTTNRTAVGARITVTVSAPSGGTRAIYRTVGTGGSFGASPLLQHIGLGAAARWADIDIWWPTSDTRQHFAHVRTDRWLTINEFATRYASSTRPPVHLGGARSKP
jgi:tetratricopeptide (TPR) repeat protein